MEKIIPFWLSKNFIIDQYQSTTRVQDCLTAHTCYWLKKELMGIWNMSQIENMDTIWVDKRKHLHFSFKLPKRLSLPVGISALFETPLFKTLFLWKAIVV